MGDCLQEQGQDFVVISSLERDLCPLLSFRACPKQRHSSDRAKLIGGQSGLLVNIVVFLSKIGATAAIPSEKFTA